VITFTAGLTPTCRRFGGGGGAGGSGNSAGLYANNKTLSYYNGIFAGAGLAGVAKSTNSGVNWEFVTNTPGTFQWLLSDGTRFVLFSTDATSVYTTTDFSTYTTINGIPELFRSTIYRVKFVDNKYFISSSVGLFVSDDLAFWRQIASGNGGNIQDICWTGTNYIVVSDSAPTVRYSSDLATWTTATGTHAAVYSCEADSSGVVVIQTTTTPFAQRSTNHGTSFANVATTMATGNPGALAHFSGTWLLSTTSGQKYSSTDGNTWTIRGSGVLTNGGGGGFAFDGTTYVQLIRNTGTGTTAATATIISTWTARSLTTISPLSGFAGGNGAIGGGGGGGGGSSTSPTAGAPGGAGGNGLAKIYTW
jgi:hypothetical protein